MKRRPKALDSKAIEEQKRKQELDKASPLTKLSVMKSE
jgi:HD-GYP domain-containing protein (c-di-GMP phosphodiesterase class II)